ncbi:hypothetical protein [Candidatus Poriferisodalis sp.]|uniref:hypothetical protein n=1 Tax=Candidatus Poriferisodalis sp. TaxID=3101277 RepID=UPI003D0D9546
MAVIGPILKALDWDATDPKQWIPEMPVPNGRVDDALLGHAGTPLVFVEAKKQGNLSPKAEEQIFDYAAKQGVPMLVLTDGDTWDLYLSMAAGAPHERRFGHIELTQSSDISPIAEDFTRFLQRDAVLSQQANFAAQQRLAEVNNRLKGKRGLASGWTSLLKERDDLLRELLIDRVEEQSGSRPWAEDVDSFLAEQVDGRNPPVKPPKQYTDAITWLQAAPANLTSGMKASISKWRGQLGDSSFASTPTAAQMPKATSKSGSVALNKGTGEPKDGQKLNGIVIGGAVHQTTTARRAIHLLAGELQRHDPGFLDRLARFTRPGMKKPRVARSPLSSLRDEHKRYYQQIPGHQDWWLMVHASSRDLQRYMREMTELAGLQWGRDIRLLFGDDTG